MKQFDISQKEKNVLYRVQLAIMDAPDMTKDVLRDLMKALGYQPKTEGYRAHVVNDYINYWWDYVGQWAWEQKDIRSTAAKKISEGIINTMGDKLKDIQYPDGELMFTKTIYSKDDSNVTYWAEIKHTSGKNSLWPSIIQLNRFGDLSSAIEPVEGDDLRVGYAFKWEV